ncbi:hypothetical protein ACFOWZ_24270 [Lentzea rhizosphaerae]|uniref:Uncharacterized protein n=1 Tax=Lentzea rhizosphaerae TaxID=2041025 RepID=A0ABV8BXZ3_9PSEU
MSSLEGMVIADFSRMLTAGHVVTEVGNRGTATHTAARASAEPLPANPATMLAAASEKPRTNVAHAVAKATTLNTTPKGRVA